LLLIIRAFRNLFALESRQTEAASKRAGQWFGKAVCRIDVWADLNLQDYRWNNLESERKRGLWMIEGRLKGKESMTVDFLIMQITLKII
jgi:hypothetical protein